MCSGWLSLCVFTKGIQQYLAGFPSLGRAKAARVPECSRRLQLRVLPYSISLVMRLVSV